jgi:hypothetical protein
LEALPGIRHVVQVHGEHDIVALATVRNLRELDALEARVQELVEGRGVRVRRIARESQQAAKQTFLELAKREAADNPIEES